MRPALVLEICQERESVPALVLNEPVFHFNHGANLSDVNVCFHMRLRFKHL